MAHHYYSNCSFAGNDDISCWVQDGWTTQLHDINFTGGCTFKNAVGEGARIESGFDFTFSGCNFDGNDSGQKAITGITQANPAVVTSSSHGFSNGQTVVIDSVVGMTEVNNLAFTVANATTNTFELSGVDSSAYTAYTSGGS